MRIRLILPIAMGVILILTSLLSNSAHALKVDADGGYCWKFDPYLRARAPYRLSLEDNIALWSRIACPTLLVAGSESFLPDPETAGVLGHFRQAELVKIEGAGHWVQHDKPAEIVSALKTFLAATVMGEAAIPGLSSSRSGSTRIVPDKEPAR